MRRAVIVHGLLTLAWTAMIPVVLVTGLKKSVPFLVAISVYALAAAHFAAYQAARGERAARENGESE